MIKHKILYIPEGKYLYLRCKKAKSDSYYIEDMSCINLITRKRPRLVRTKVEAIFTWSPKDTFFSDNKIPYPLLKEEIEIIEEEVDD